MADELISRQALLSEIDGYMKNAYDCPLDEVAEFQRSTNDTKLIYAVEGLYEATEIIDDVPAVDAVEVVRCKDCKKNPRFSKTSGKHMVWCRKWRCEVKDTDFCSYGERREENAAD